MKIFEVITEIFGWLQIVASPFFLGLGFGFIIYLLKPDEIGFIMAVLISLIGLIVGVLLATKIWKKKGAINFISRNSETPELDDKSSNE